MVYKMIALDLDGTLLNDGKVISKENKSVLNTLNNKGIEIVIATGRRYYSAKKFISDLDFELVILANNGNIVRDISDDRVLIKRYLEEESFYSLIKIAREEDLYPIVHVDHYEQNYDLLIELDVEHEKYGGYMHRTIERFKSIDDLLNYKGGRVLVVCYKGELDTLQAFQQKLQKRYPEVFHAHVMNNLPNLKPLLEIMNPLGSKWLSLKEYAARKNIKADEIIAIGDDNNDIEMIQKSGLGIAMKNGSKEVKRVADCITEKNNNQSGVGQILSKIFNL